ncbi:GtrA family protein [Prauserella flavalba]|uniref:GtrA family protein n=1 Tax=Prauserella flavalba TaxID=1477506 RepID=UPI0036F02CF0
MSSVGASAGEHLLATLTRLRHEFGRHALLYVAAGTVTTLLQALVYLAVRAPLGAQAANLVAIGLTTAANTEFHRLVTFAGSTTPPARRHLQTVLTFGYYAGAGSAALVLLHALNAAPSPELETVVLVATSLAGGICRFLLLRSWVFARPVKMIR